MSHTLSTQGQRNILHPLLPVFCAAGAVVDPDLYRVYPYLVLIAFGGIFVLLSLRVLLIIKWRWVLGRVELYMPYVWCWRMNVCSRYCFVWDVCQSWQPG